ncbi:MAG: energy-coupling factor ABC transporter ATP-binding protein [Armatimonadetes bacterium]|nr:energy-coupling factor ABC transporter ATP-binding protein [Armatimonadota bacterium]
MADAAWAVDIGDLHFAYPDGTLALRGVDLQVREGERLALLGPNGAGKSTLLLHLNGLLRGTGSVTVFGLPVVPRHLGALRRQVGLVFQDPDDQLFMPSVGDEVAYGAISAGYEREEVRRRVGDALAAVGLAGLEHKHPLNLSVGQQKRLAIASVLVTDSRLLVLDEPSAGLDPAGRRALVSLLAQLPVTQIVATHDLDLAAELCGAAALMAEGRVARAGATGLILGDEAFLRECGM